MGGRAQGLVGGGPVVRAGGGVFLLGIGSLIQVMEGKEVPSITLWTVEVVK